MTTIIRGQTMKLNKITLALSPLLFLSTMGYAQTNCQEENFWQVWYPKGQFVGFGTPPSINKIAIAQYEFAEKYHSGNILTKDYSRALDLFKRAADQGLTQAHFKLGLINHYGQGKAKDLNSAYLHYEKAAQHSSPEAEFNLGLMNRYGIGRTKNMTASFKWFTKAVQAKTAQNIDRCEINLTGVK